MPREKDAFFRAIELACVGLVSALAAWTLVCHLVVFVAGGSFALLRWLAIPAALLAGVAVWQLRPARRDRPRAGHGAVAEEIPRVERSAFFLGASVLVLVLYQTGDVELFWLLSVVFLAAAYLRARAAGPPALCRVPSKTWERWVVLALALLVAVLTLVVHRPDSDDGFLLNIAVSALDAPAQRLLFADTIHNLEGFPLALPTYRAHTIELLYALASWLGGLEPITIAHVVFPPVAAVFSILVASNLAREVMGSAWLITVLAVVAFWLGMGDTHSGFGNHAYVRLFQGKAVMVTVLAPLIVLFSLRFMIEGGWRNWSLLALGQIAALGLSATALFVAPLTMGFAALGAWRPTRLSCRRLLLAGASSFYLMIVVLGLRSSIMTQLPALNGAALYGRTKDFAACFEQVFGGGHFMLLQIGGALACWTVVRDPRWRRLLLGWVLAFFALVVNPFTFDLWIQHVTSGPVAFRLFWTLPVPFLVAVTIAEPLGGLVPRWRWPVLAAVLLACFWVFPKRSTLSPWNRLDYAAPGPKVPPDEYAVARAIARLAPEGTTALAPREVVMWVTTRPGHPRVLAHKYNHLHVVRPLMGDREFQRRFDLFAYVQGHRRSPRIRELLLGAIEIDHLGVVVAHQNMKWIAELGAIMDAAGFEAREVRGYLVWTAGAATATISAQ